MTRKSRVWWYSGSRSWHCCFEYSLLLFPHPVDEPKKDLLDEHVDETLLEVLEASDADRDVILNAMRLKHDT